MIVTRRRSKMDNDEAKYPARKQKGPLNTSTPKVKLSEMKHNDKPEDFTNISFESNHTEPPSSFSPLLPSDFEDNSGDIMPKMTQSSAKRSTITQTPSVKASSKRKNPPRRSSRSRSRGRQSRRSTPVRTMGPQAATKTEVAENPSSASRRRTVRSAVKDNSAPFENLAVQMPLKYETTFDTEKPKKLSLPGSNLLTGHPYLLIFIRLLMCVLYAFIIYKAVTYFGADRFVINQWKHWNMKIRKNLSP